MRTFSSVGTEASSSRQRSSVGGAIPFASAGDASPYHSSGSPNAALSRASFSVSAMTSASSEPAHASPCRPPATTRIPSPSVLAVVNDSTSPPNTSTSVSRVRTT